MIDPNEIETYKVKRSFPIYEVLFILVGLGFVAGFIIELIIK